MELTREQILALSGRDLDRAVAIHVFGWAPSEWDDARRRVLPRFSLDVGDAWEVVQWLATFGGKGHCDIGIFLGAGEPPDWKPFCTVSIPCRPDLVADTFPVAVCRAALLRKLEEARG